MNPESETFMIMVRKTFFYSLENTVGLVPKKIIRRSHRFVGKSLVGWLVGSMTNGVSAKLETATHWQCSQISSDYLLLLPRFRPRTAAKRARDREIHDETNDFSLEPHGIFKRNSARSAVYIGETTTV